MLALLGFLLSAIGALILLYIGFMVVVGIFSWIVNLIIKD